MRKFTCVADIGDLAAAVAEALEVKRDRFAYQHLGRNKNFLLVIGALLVLQFLFVTFGGAVLSVEPLSWAAWLVCLLIAFLIIPIDIIRKAITSKKK